MLKSKFSKISFNDKNLWKSYGSQVGAISSLVTLAAFCMSPSGGWTWKIICSLIFLFGLGTLFVYKWYKANQAEYADLKINGTKVKVQIGDLFEQEGLKIIGVNNYIDLIADDVVVSKATLHGKFMEQHQNEIHEISAAISNSKTLILEKDSVRYGQTRFRECIPEKQELLEIALWTLKESGFRNKYPNGAINFIIYEGDAPEIDFYRIQKKFK